MPQTKIQKLMMYICRILYYIFIISLFAALLGNCKSFTKSLTLKLINYESTNAKNISFYSR